MIASDDLDDRPTAGGRAGVAVAIIAGIAFAAWFYSQWFALQTLTVSPDAAARRSLRWLTVAFVVAATLWAIRPANRWLARGLDAIRAPTPARRCFATVAVTLAAAAYFYATALEFGRVLVPAWQDSNMHMVQARLLTHGKFWAAEHPLADHLETLFVFTRPIYAAIHFPGTSMLYAPLMAIGVPPAVFATLVAGAIVGLTYRVVAEAVDGVAAALAVPLLIGTAPLRQASVMLLSHSTLVVPALLGTWAFLRWRRAAGGDLRWAAAIGAFVGFAGITRPVEALAYGVAIGLVICCSLRGRAWTRWATTAASIVAGALPFVCLQLVIDAHVTGHALLPPYEHYVRIFHPQSSFGDGGDGGDRAPASIPTNLPQKVDYYMAFVVPWIRRAEQFGPLESIWNARLPLTIAGITPHPAVLALWPAALLGMRGAARRALPLTVPAMLALYVPNLTFLPHYGIAVAPAGAMLTVLGMRAIATSARRGGRRSIEVPLAALVCFAGLAGTPQGNADVAEFRLEWLKSTVYANTRLSADVRQPAAVLFRYRSWDEPYVYGIDNVHDEPVYTFDVERPEDSPVARFQDLGPERNRELYRFFAERQPERNFYLFDRRTQLLTPLGTARELLERGEPPTYARRRPRMSGAR